MCRMRAPLSRAHPIGNRPAPRVYERAGFVVTLWTYYEPVKPQGVSPADYANALERLHAGMRKLDVTTPHFINRGAVALQLVAIRDHTPAPANADRELLSNTLQSLSGGIVTPAELLQPDLTESNGTGDSPLRIKRPMKFGVCISGVLRVTGSAPARLTRPRRP
jgi:hypothetical protein